MRRPTVAPAASTRRIGVKPLTRPENISLREMREGIAPSDPGPVDQPELDL